MKPQAAKTKPPAVIMERLAESRAVQAISANRTPIVLAAWMVLRIVQTLFMQPNQDCKRYFDTASQWLGGLIPYAQFELEYPPGALVLFAIPRFLTNDFARYCSLFGVQMLLIDILIVVLLWRISPRLLDAPHTGSGKTPAEAARRYDSTVCIVAYMLFSAITGALSLERYDLACTALFLIWLYCTVGNKKPWLSDLFIAAGIWLKLISILVVPVYLVFLFASTYQGNRSHTAQMWKDFLRWGLQQGLARLASIAAFTCALFLPFYFQSGPAITRFLQYHGQRGLQLESLYSGFFLVARVWFGVPLFATHAYGATELVNPGSDLIMSVARASSILTILAEVGVSCLFGWRILRAATQKERNFLLLHSTLALLLTLILFNKVFSPQYLLWVAPFAALVILDNQEKTRHWLLGFGLIYFLTCLILIFYYFVLIAMHPFPVLLLVTRNFLVAGMLWAVLDISFAKSKGTSEVWDSLRDWVTHPNWGLIAFFLCATWTFFANLSETTANDIWIQLRSGEDIARTWQFPDKEVYSATVFGRPFIAHEWLSGLIFYGLVKVWGGAGLSFLAAVVALATFILMYFAIQKEQRNTIYFMCLLLMATYLVSFRILVRPHIFTIVAQAALLLALERWRRTGRIKELVWLVPMQLVWVNLHGAALFGPSLMGLLCGVVAVMVMVPSLQRGSEVRQFTKTDVMQLGGITTAMCLACIVNPYGTQLVTFSLDLLGNDYAKSRVWEWTTPFLPGNFSYYWLWLFIFTLSLLWVSILVRIRTLPVIDTVLAVVVTYFGVRANRFVPEVAIFSYPVIARSLQSLLEFCFSAERRIRRPWIEIGFACLLLCNAATYGYAHSFREHRPQIGWGFGGDMPYQEVDIVKKLHLKGIIFNEYSDGALIIHELVPQVRPVLDSRIDLYPYDIVTEYDRAYMSPELFRQYVKKHRVNIVCLYQNRAHPGVLAYLAADKATWQLLSKANGRVLYRKRSDSEVAGTASVGPNGFNPL